MSHFHLSIIERGQLETLSRLGLSVRTIARHINRHHSTVARVPRGKFPQVFANAIQEKLYLT